jgi:hypothetical protein
MSIYQDLVEKFNFNQKYNSVKRFVRKLKHKTPKQFDRLEFLPGEEAQVDYGKTVLTMGSTIPHPDRFPQQLPLHRMLLRNLRPQP